MVSEGIEKSGNLVDLETYLERLTQVDRINLQNLVSALTAVLQEQGRKGVVKAVGGTINKPLPRKDLDITLKLSEEEADPKLSDTKNYLEFSKARFIILKDIIEPYVVLKAA